MKYNIQILSKHNAILQDMKDLNEDTIVISIDSPNEQEHKFRNEKIKDVLHLHFDDLTYEQYIRFKDKRDYELVLFNGIHTKQIHDFIDKYINIHNIIIHCAMGVSRSGAVGVVLSKYLNGEDLYLYQRGGIKPNKTVYKIMCEEFGIKYDEKELERKIKISNKVTNKIVGKIYADNGLNIDDMFINEEIKLI